MTKNISYGSAAALGCEGNPFPSEKINGSTSKPHMKIRLDKLLVERGLVASRERAQAVILAGRVLVNGQKIEKSGTSVEADADVRLLGEDLKYVSRGGLKLEATLHHWKIDLK